MEMNTRIQVEHGVTELVYALRFENPDAPGEFFVVERLIEAMLLLCVHGPRVPRPVRVPRALSGVEVRINATNQALQPHAGGLIRSWTPAIPGELRFDQGIGAPNPDNPSTSLWRPEEGAIQMMPTAPAVVDLLEFLGFAEVRRLDPHSDQARRYHNGTRATFLATRPGG